eukprot:3510357-Ditylum_brightwellii.AAC.1
MNSGIDMHAEWVKAYQDNTTAKQLLSIEAQLIVQADADVTSFRLNKPPHLQPSSIPLQLTSTRATLVINNITVTSNLHKIIRDNYLCSDMSRYIQCQTGLSSTQMEEIDWDSLGAALESQKTAHTNPPDKVHAQLAKYRNAETENL